MKKIFCLFIVLLNPLQGVAERIDNEEKILIVYNQNLQWIPGPHGFAEGSEYAMIDGDPNKPEPYTIRVRLPENYKMMPHTTSSEQRITIIQGSCEWGNLIEFGAWQTAHLRAGDYIRRQANSVAFLKTNEPFIYQVTGIGPIQMKRFRQEL